MSGLRPEPNHGPCKSLRSFARLTRHPCTSPNQKPLRCKSHPLMSHGANTHVAGGGGGSGASQISGLAEPREAQSWVLPCGGPPERAARYRDSHVARTLTRSTDWTIVLFFCGTNSITMKITSIAESSRQKDTRALQQTALGSSSSALQGEERVFQPNGQPRPYNACLGALARK